MLDCGKTGGYGVGKLRSILYWEEIYMITPIGRGATLKLISKTFLITVTCDSHVSCVRLV